MRKLENENNINVTINENDHIKIFEGLKHSTIAKNEQLLDILDLNAEQLTYYLEDIILDNPFVDLEYSLEQQIPAFERLEGTREVEEMKRNKQSLDTYLFEQIMLYRQTEIRDTMVKAIEYLDERGFLPYTNKELATLLDVPEIITLDAVTLIKQLEPAGIGAYDLRESMMIQTEQDDHAPAGAYYLLENFFQELSEQDYVEITTQTNITMEEIKNSVNYYHTLRVNPAALFDQVAKINIIPDVTVRPSGQNIAIRYNRQYYPKISFNQNYYKEMLARDDEQLTDYVKPHKVNFQKLADDLRLREQLFLEVVSHIVRAQVDYFSNQSDSVASLSIKQVARAARLSIPIVYRIVTNKNIEFNGHVYALADFINVSRTVTREGLNASFIKDKIKEMITDNSAISNEEIQKLFEEEQIIVSVQIINSYRRSLGQDNTI